MGNPYFQTLTQNKIEKLKVYMTNFLNQMN